MQDAATIISAVAGSGGILTAIGGVGRFIWHKLERRFSRIEAELEKCREREQASIEREKASIERRAVQVTVIELLWQEVMRHAPDSSVLARARKLLDALKSQGTNSSGCGGG